MALTLEELKEKLKRLDEVTLMEILDLDSEQLVETYSDIIEENFEFYERQVEETEY